MYFSTFNVRFVFHSVVSSVCVYTERVWIHAFIDKEKGVNLCPTTTKRQLMTKKKKPTKAHKSAGVGRGGGLAILQF